MRTGLVIILSLVMLPSVGCFHAKIATDYPTDAATVLLGHPRIPAKAVLVLSKKQKKRKDSASQLGLKVTVKTGDTFARLNRAIASGMFQDVVEIDKVAPSPGYDLILEPKIESVEAQVHGILYSMRSTTFATFSLTAYDRTGRSIWTDSSQAKHESETMFSLRLLLRRNQVATETYEDFVIAVKELYDRFYSSEPVLNYLSSLGIRAGETAQ